jgi:hypothetical protein
MPPRGRKILAALILIGPSAAAGAGPCDVIQYAVPPQTLDILACISELRAEIKTLRDEADLTIHRRQAPGPSNADAMLQIRRDQCAIARDLRALRASAKLGPNESEQVCNAGQERYIKPE